MKAYDDGDWAISTIFILDGSVIYKGCIWAVPSGLSAVALQYCFKYAGIGPYAQDADLAQLQSDWEGVLSTYSVAMAFLLVFRTQIAYSRLWDAISSLQKIRGAWINCVSGCLAFCSVEKHKAEEAETFKNHLVRLVSLLYGSAITSVCQEDKQYDVVDFTGIEESSLTWLASQPNQCEIVLQWIQCLLVEKQRSGLLDAPPPILSRAFQELGNGILHLSDARCIKLVPFPFPYAQIISLILCLHVLFTVLVAGFTTQSGAAAFCRCFMCSFVFWSVNYIAIEIERPYGEDANDLPLDELVAGMNSALVNLLQHPAQRPPHYDMCHASEKSKPVAGPRMFSSASWRKKADEDCVDEAVMLWSRQVTEWRQMNGQMRRKRSRSRSRSADGGGAMSASFGLFSRGASTLSERNDESALYEKAICSDSQSSQSPRGRRVCERHDTNPTVWQYDPEREIRLEEDISQLDVFGTRLRHITENSNEDSQMILMHEVDMRIDDRKLIAENDAVLMAEETQISESSSASSNVKQEWQDEQDIVQPYPPRLAPVATLGWRKPTPHAEPANLRAALQDIHLPVGNGSCGDFNLHGFSVAAPCVTPLQEKCGI
eukprot:TRINITY_DN21467_c0_g1_i1.p1 TRINITY_DN21467_c0_g1~~TRINITY_DN21467_c0_g1_i1.p1  ORF type:complete len:602 (+),score=85.03 TRINITY_DN21467_c0_g1_i1:158-1963(+)